MENDLERPATETDWQVHILSTLRRMAVALSVFDPDHPLHDHFMSIGTRGSELSAEGRGHLSEVTDLAA